MCKPVQKIIVIVDHTDWGTWYKSSAQQVNAIFPIFQQSYEIVTITLYNSQWGNWGLNESGALLKRSHSKEHRTNSCANLSDCRAHFLNHNMIFPKSDGLKYRKFYCLIQAT